MNLFLPDDETATSTIGGTPSRLHRSPDKRLFAAPMVLINQGFDRAAFCDFDVLFQHSLQSIKGTEQDSDLLMFLAGVLNTPLSHYYLFHTSSNWGVERDKVHFAELLRLPFTLPEQTRNPKRSKEIVKLVANRIQEAMKVDFLSRNAEIQAAKRDIQTWVYEYYGISEQEAILIEDTVILAIKSSTPTSIDWDANIPSLKMPDERERNNYASVLCDTLNNWTKSTQQKFTCHTSLAPKLGLSVITLKADVSVAYSEQDAQSHVESLLSSIFNSLEKRLRTFVVHRGLIHFDGGQVHLLKPLTLRHWSKSAALNDANNIFAALVRD